MNTHANADAAVLIGRFQPFHKGHASLLRMALDAAPKVIVVLGSSFHARSAKNPFTWQERAAMITATLAPEERGRVSYVAVRDYYEDARWAGVVSKKVQQCAAGARRIALVGYIKDNSSHYLNHFPQWQEIFISDAADIHATAIRSVLFEAEDIDVSLAVVDALVPLAVRHYLRAWSLLPCYRPLVQEHKAVQAYRAAWRAAPYAPIFSTADALVKTAGHVLLIQRGGFPGKGLWALPGGFIEQHERVLQGALRELAEETGLAVLASSLAAALVDVKVFDHPARSLRGRTITHAHFFDLQTEQLPAVQGADDAAQARWTPIADLAGMEEQFFDDHFHILDHFLRLTRED
ncbi:bifunctional nicotinamide-nucleotide adenylyltransferase/Nudix hydroxylase [Janthinobacterium fluminis]|uniref:Bifunctional nicotinamide-nucleotide adenylyltransferase/Nudix hydroxylase n=1 Tax=Janthinobacterium fluminis TaxID=2987524 RepID=A0ABT5JWL4_9BURK|nr:bifunctional nicotinamide-nucleotide adenylyltransferase/Nudix hydroxylase [Janthinobacterium fluminis]MDC8757134.1 bifunctional nicotinamide-nucleotide adenylyltransferase/Nudix hydroxylase [Janthinobacterium fluminis]